MSTSYDGWVDKSLHLQNLLFSLSKTEVFGCLRRGLRVSKSCPWDAPGRPRRPLRAPWGLSRALLGSLGLSWGCLGPPWGRKTAQSWGPSEISEIVTTPKREVHFRPFMGLSLGSFGALLDSLGGLLDSFGALLARLWFLVGSPLLS